VAIPKLDVALVAFSGNFSRRINDDPERFAISPQTAAALATLQGPYADAYAALMAARAEGTRSESMTCRKDSARADMLVLLRQLYTTVQASTAVSDADKISLGVHVRSDSPRPVPAPTERPNVSVIGVVNRTVTVNIYDPTAKTNRRKADGAVFADVYVCTGSDYPSDATLWQHAGATSRAMYDVHFPDSVAAGAQVWICAAWRTRRGLTGPRSVPATTHVQGGGVSQPGMVRIAA